MTRGLSNAGSSYADEPAFAVSEELRVLPANARVPTALEHITFAAVPLTPDVAALDYDAYMSSPDVIRVHSDGRWPVDGFTFECDLALVREHWSDHQARRSFAFTLLTPSRDEGVGCLYLNPLRKYLERAGASSQMIDAYRPHQRS